MSADSGLPTFTDPLAVWGASEGSPGRAALESGISPLALFREHPPLAWPLYLSRLEACVSARIHNGYQALWKLSRMIPGECAVLTSNVDGLFPRAGFPLVHECHGQINRLQCSIPCSQETWSASFSEIRQGLDQGKFPACPHCGSAARPNISWGDSAFAHAEGDGRAGIFSSAVEAMHGSILLIECGVSPASGLRRFADDFHRQRGEAFLLRINPDAKDACGEHSMTVAATAETGLVELLNAYHSVTSE